MILFEMIAVALLVALATGGSLRSLEKERLKGEIALLVLLPLQLVWPRIVEAAGMPCELAIIMWLLMMAVLAAVLFMNSARRWMLAFAGLGIALNVLVIGANQAMPVSLKATGEIGVSRASAVSALEESCLHEALDEHTAVPGLADVIAVPGPTWHRGVASIGDLVLSLGLAGWILSATRRRDLPAE